MTDIAVNAKSADAKVPPPASSPSPNSASGASPSIDASFKIPNLFRGLSQEGTEYTKENWQVMNSAVEKLTSMIQDTSSTAAKESMEYGLKVMEMAQANTSAAIALANGLMGAKTPSEVIELSSTHAREQLNAIVKQNRQLWMAAQRVASSMIEPVNNACGNGAGRRK